jgi:hypothetical protein
VICLLALVLRRRDLFPDEEEAPHPGSRQPAASECHWVTGAVCGRRGAALPAAVGYGKWSALTRTRWKELRAAATAGCWLLLLLLLLLLLAAGCWLLPPLPLPLGLRVVAQKAPPFAGRRESKQATR